MSYNKVARQFHWHEIRRRRKNRNRKARAGKNSFSQTPFLPVRSFNEGGPFCPPERSVSAVPPTAGAISRSFVQKRFERRSVIATDIKNIDLN